MTRVAVFVDYQNVYHRCRGALGWKGERPQVGQVHPRRLAQLVTARGRRVDPQRRLTKVSVFRGQPSEPHDRRGHFAVARQHDMWARDPMIESYLRTLDYLPKAWDERGRVTAHTPREKGIDVLLAVSLALGAARDDYDVAVLCSQDTDLMPALEAASDLGKRVEVMSWGRARPWRINGRGIWCHVLGAEDYVRIRDEVDHTRSSS